MGAVALAIGLLAPASQAALSPGLGIKLGNARLSPFVELSMGYDSNVRLTEGQALQLQQDGSYEVQSTKVGDYFSQFAAGVGLSRVLASEWDLRLRTWYDTRLYAKETQINYDSVTVEGSGRYWPVSDIYSLTMGGKYREAQDVERIPSSASLTMPGETPLPYLEERDDRLKRVTMDGFGVLAIRPQERTSFSLGANASTVDYDDNQLFDYWQWSLNGNAGYRYSEKTYIFLEGNYELVDGEALTRKVPVYAVRLGFNTKPRVKLEYKVGVGVKTYEYATDETGDSLDRKWDIDFDGLLNWRYSEKLSLFGKAWTDVGTAVQFQAPENTRRTYAGQVGADYAFMKRFNATSALSYRLDSYDYPIDYGQNLTQEKSELWQIMGRVTMAPRSSAFWKVFVESSYELGDNDLDTYNQWLVWVGASLWY
jgi:hypothetical protein